MHRLLILAGLLGLASCASPPLSEETAGGTDAITVGSSFRSPIKEGYYDDGYATLFVSSAVGYQKIDLEDLRATDGSGLSCRGNLDLPLGSGEMRVDSDDYGCAITLRVDGDAIHVQGTIDYQTKHLDVDATLRPRKDDAFVGSYVDGMTKETAKVTASSNESATLSLNDAQGEVIATLQRAERQNHYAEFAFNRDSRCPLTASFSFRSDGRRVIFIGRGSGATSAKCPANLPLMLTEE